VSYVALDLSVRSTGWAMWSAGQPLPTYGTWELAGDLDHLARAYVRLHRNLFELHRLDAIESLVFEEAIPGHMLRGQTSAITLQAAAGLAAHAMSFCEALGIRWRPVSIAAWRRHYIGSVPRGTKTPDFKHLSMTRCRELGFNPAKHDAAEACGLLDYQLSTEGVLPPWRNALQTELLPAEGQAAA
jgi:hypothetical protein